MDANKRCVQMRVVVDGDDDAVKFAEAFALLANEFTFRCTFTNEAIVRPI